MSELKTAAAVAHSVARLGHPPTRLVRYGVAVALVAAALLLRWAIFGHLDHRLPFAFFLFAVMVASWFGGLGPGLLAAVAGLLLGDYFFLPQHGAYAPLSDAERATITIYAINATLVVVLMENLHGRIRRLRREAEARAAEDQRPSINP